MQAPFSRTYFDLACEQAARYGDAPALIHQGEITSYARLWARVEMVAAALRHAGVKPGERIGLLLPNCPQWVEIALGAGGAGAIAVPFSTWSMPQELDFLLRDSGVTMLFAAAQFGERDYAADLAALAPEIQGGGTSDKYPALRRLVLIGGQTTLPAQSYESFLTAPAAPAPLPPGEAAHAGEDALILYTSGSSAHPKAVRLKHHGIIENGFNIGERQGYRPGDKVLLAPPLFWSYGSANALSAALTHGAAVVLQEKFDAAESIALIARHGCTAIYTLPGITTAILRDASFAPEKTKTLRTGLTIGSPQDVQEAALKLGIAEICNVYGATETYGNCCVTWHHWPLEKRMNCQGPPLPGNEIRFVDEQTGAVVAPGEPGLAEVRGYVTPGYCGVSAQQNAATFTADGFYRTGDMGRFDEKGNFVFVGRNTEMIKRAGINISPAEVENILLLHEQVESAGVVGAADRARGELVIAFVVPKKGAKPTESELLAHCRAVASKYKVPDRIEIRAALPLTPTGKLQRRALKQDAAEIAAARETARG